MLFGNYPLRTMHSLAEHDMFQEQSQRYEGTVSKLRSFLVFGKSIISNHNLFYLSFLYCRTKFTGNKFVVYCCFLVLHHYSGLKRTSKKNTSYNWRVALLWSFSAPSFFVFQASQRTYHTELQFLHVSKNNFRSEVPNAFFDGSVLMYSFT